MSKPIVILIPAYRCADTIAETIDSILKQGPPLSEIREVVVADDGSHDGTCDVARAAWTAPVPLRILDRQFNCGEYASVNNAVEQFPADIEWFLIMHADNMAKDGWLAAFLDRIEHATDDVALIGSSYDYLTTAGSIRPGENEPDDRTVNVPGTRASVADTLRRGCWWHISSCAIRVAAFRKVGGLPKVMQLAGDWDFMLRVQADGWTIEHLPRSLMVYRENPVGSSSLMFRHHRDIWEKMMVIGRFHWALNGGSLTRLHAQNAWFLMRRVVRCLIDFDIVRLAWVFPALGCVAASYVTCVLDRERKAGVAPQRVAEQRIA
ncbi:MAG TPA: glycosyltransferase [Bryobacteraceae bacterium]|nr:glycosyltransferase [Bryobacteraceae bacterium]